MGIKFCDGFDSYAASADLVKKWLSADPNWTWVSNAGRFGTGAIRHAGGAGGQNLLSPFGFNTSTGDHSIGFYLKASAAPGTTASFLVLANASNGLVGDFQLSNTGQLLVRNYHGSVAITSLTNVCDNVFHWIEMRYLPGSTMFLNIDNVNQGTGSGGVFGGSSYDHLQVTSISGVQLTIDDIFAWDANVPTFPQNARQISPPRPVSDGTIGFTTTSSGSTHFNLVNEVNPDGDTSYVQSIGATDQDLLNFSALGYTPTNITGVVVNVYCETPNGGSINVQGICKSGAAAQVNGTAQAVPLVYRTLQFPFLTDPNTSAAWTAAGLNAAQFGYKNA